MPSSGWSAARTPPRPRILGALQAAERIPLNLCGKPFQPLLAVWCRDQDIQLIHAGLVCLEGRGLLIAGESGAGKSTTSLACACNGFGFLGDDCVGFDRSEAGGLRGHALYASGFLMPEDVPRLPALAHACEARAEQPKQLVYLARAPSVACHTSVSLAALVLPRVSDRAESRLRPVSKYEALLALTRSSMLGGRPRQDARGLESLAALTLELPVWGMDAGRDFAGRASALRDLVASGDWR